MHLLGEVLALSAGYLKDKGVESPRLTAEILLGHVLQKKRLDLYMQFECPLEEGELKQFRSLLKRAALHEPTEYILSETEFYGCSLALSKDVLIPRQETEILVDKAISEMKKDDLAGRVVWDICTGSGCIGLSVKKKIPELKVFLSDVSEKALAVCRENAKKNSIEAEFFLGDLFEPFLGKKAHYIFCNPPYVTEAEYDGLRPSVKNYEPKQALVSGTSGLEFYERLSRELPSYLISGGKVFLEIGSGQGNELNKIFLSSLWRKKELFFDYAGKDRSFFLEIE